MLKPRACSRRDAIEPALVRLENSSTIITQNRSRGLRIAKYCAKSSSRNRARPPASSFKASVSSRQYAAGVSSHDQVAVERATGLREERLVAEAGLRDEVLPQPFRPRGAMNGTQADEVHALERLRAGARRPVGVGADTGEDVAGDVAIPRRWAVGGVVDDLREATVDVLRLAAPPIKTLIREHVRVAARVSHQRA